MEKSFLKIKKIIEDKFLMESDFKIKTSWKCWMVFCASVISFQITIGFIIFNNQQLQPFDIIPFLCITAILYQFLFELFKYGKKDKSFFNLFALPKERFLEDKRINILLTTEERECLKEVLTALENNEFKITFNNKNIDLNKIKEEVGESKLIFIKNEEIGVLDFLKAENFYRRYKMKKESFLNIKGIEMVFNLILNKDI
jgi:hypothetical protein